MKIRWVPSKWNHAGNFVVTAEDESEQLILEMFINADLKRKRWKFWLHSFSFTCAGDGVNSFCFGHIKWSKKKEREWHKHLFAKRKKKKES